MKVYFENFASLEDVIESFCINPSVVEGIEIIYAAYDTPAYEGYAHVIFISNGKVYEVNGSHCSCYGLEEQWGPEETLVSALLSRPNVDERAKNNLKEYFKDLLVFL